MADIETKMRKTVPLSVYKARFSKKYAENETAIQKRVEKNHLNQLKIWRQEMILANQKPF